MTTGELIRTAELTVLQNSVLSAVAIAALVALVCAL
jgi:hypothetical protein